MSHAFRAGMDLQCELPPYIEAILPCSIFIYLLRRCAQAVVEESPQVVGEDAGVEALCHDAAVSLHPTDHFCSDLFRAALLRPL